MQLRIILLALVLLPLAAASTILLDSTQQEACATQQLVIAGMLQNGKSQSDTFRLHVESSDGLSAFVSPTLEIAGYSEEKFNLFLSPVCLDAGTYEYDVIADSTRGETISQKGSISINDCDLMELRVSQQKTNVCNGDAASFQIAVKNLGNEEQNFTLTTDLDDASYTLTKRKFILSPFEEGKATLNLNIPADLYKQGMLTFNIQSQSTYSCGSNSRTVLASVYVERCDGIKITALDEVYVQANTQEMWNLFFDNSVTADDYDLGLSCPGFAKLPKNTLSLGEKESLNLNIPVYPKAEDVGDYICKLTATSAKFGTQYSASMKLHVVQNFAVALIAPSEIKVCKGEDALVQIKLLNKGKANKYLLGTSSEVELSAKEIDAAANSSNEFGLRIKGSALESGINTVEVQVKSPYASAKSSTAIIVENCFESGISISPRIVEMCAGNGGESVAIKVANKGTKEDAYALSVIDAKGFVAEFSSQQAFRLKPGEKKEINLNLKAPVGVKPGSYELQVKSRGADGEELASFTAKVLPVDICHSLKLDVDSLSKRTGAGIGNSFRITITNDGRFREKVELFLSEKPAWAYITPSSIDVLAATKEEALIYFAPPLNEELGDNKIVLEARGKYLQKSLLLNVQVIALETGSGEAKIDLSQTGMARELEVGTETPLTLNIQNSGDVDLHNASILFSEYVSILAQNPFDLKAGEGRDVPIVITIGEEAGSEIRKIRMGVYAKEGFAERDFEIKGVESRLEIFQLGSEKEAGGFKIALALKNKGKDAMNLRPQTLENATFSEAEIELEAGAEEIIEVTLGEGRETLIFKDTESGKVYRKRIEVEEGGGITGLFVASLGRVLPLLIAIIAGAIALYFVASRKDGIASRLNGKKGEINGQDDEPSVPNDALIYEEGGEQMDGQAKEPDASEGAVFDEGKSGEEGNDGASGKGVMEGSALAASKRAISRKGRQKVSGRPKPRKSRSKKGRQLRGDGGASPLEKFHIFTTEPRKISKTPIKVKPNPYKRIEKYFIFSKKPKDNGNN